MCVCVRVCVAWAHCRLQQASEKEDELPSQLLADDAVAKKAEQDCQRNTGVVIRRGERARPVWLMQARGNDMAERLDSLGKEDVAAYGARPPQPG